MSSTIVCENGFGNGSHSVKDGELFIKLLQAVNRFLTQALSDVLLAYLDISPLLGHEVE